MAIIKYIKNTLKFFKKKGYKSGGVTEARIATLDYNNRLEGKWVLITGGSSGIGFATAEACIKAGARVIITGRNENKLQNAITNLGNCSFSIKWDVCELNFMDDVVDQIYKITNGNFIDCLVCNAGSTTKTKFEDFTEPEYMKLLDTHLKANFFLVQRIIKEWESKKISGCIVAVSSHSGLKAEPDPYYLAKAGLNHFVKAIGKRGLEYGTPIRCNAVCPGPTLSDIGFEFTEAKNSGNIYRNSSRSKRYAMSEEVAEVILFLLSEESKTCTGQIIACDMGSSIL